MNKLLFKLLLLCALLALTACNLSLPANPTSEPHVIATAWTALLVGTLEKEDGCLRVKSQDSDVSYLLVWPPDSSAESSEDTVRVVTGLVTGNRQEVVLNIGEVVRLGGGTTTRLDKSLSVAANCPGPYWVVGGVVD